MKRLLVGLVLLAMCAGGAVAFAGQASPPDPLAARILELQQVYQSVIVESAGLEAQLNDLKQQKLRLEGAIMELQRYQAMATAAKEAEAKSQPQAAEPPEGASE